MGEANRQLDHYMSRIEAVLGSGWKRMLMAAL